MVSPKGIQRQGLGKVVQELETFEQIIHGSVSYRLQNGDWDHTMIIVVLILSPSKTFKSIWRYGQTQGNKTCSML